MIFFSHSLAIVNHLKPHIVLTEPRKKASWAVNLLEESNCLMGFPLLNFKSFKIVHSNA